MRITQPVFAWSVYRKYKLAWEVFKRKPVHKSREIVHAEKLGLPTVKAEDFLKKAQEEIAPIEVDNDIHPADPLYQPLKRDASHPLYKPDPLLCINDTNVLLEGLDQAKVLLNTVQIQEGLPNSVEDEVGTRAIPFQDTRVKRAVMYSNVYDATQVRLPTRKDPERPAWNFPRDYGIDSKRRFHLTISQMLQLCGYVDHKAALANRTITSDTYFCTCLGKDDFSFQIQNRADVLVTSKNPISSIAAPTAGSTVPLPNLYPLKCNVSLQKQHFYHTESVFPLAREYSKPHPHMAFFHYDPQEVKNLYEEPVTDSQFLSRTLVKAFAVAASRAQQLYGDNVKKLPEPITLQAVHSDNKRFHFAILQLNTLDLDATEERNIFWMLPNPIDLFSECAYVKGVPTLENYNPEVFQRILSFYCHGLL